MGAKRSLRIPIFDTGYGGAGARTLERVLVATDDVQRLAVDPATETGCVHDDVTETDAWPLPRIFDGVGYRAGRPPEG